MKIQFYKRYPVRQVGNRHLVYTALPDSAAQPPHIVGSFQSNLDGYN